MIKILRMICLMKVGTINSNAIKVDWVVNKAVLDLVIKAGLQLSVLVCFNRSAVHFGRAYLGCKLFQNAQMRKLKTRFAMQLNVKLPFSC